MITLPATMPDPFSTAEPHGSRRRSRALAVRSIQFIHHSPIGGLLAPTGQEVDADAWVDWCWRPAAGPSCGSGAGDERQGISGQGPRAADNGHARDSLSGFFAPARRDHGFRAGVPRKDRDRPETRQTAPLLSAAQGPGTGRFCVTGGELRYHTRCETPHERQIRILRLHGRALSLRGARKAYSVRPSRSSKTAKATSATNAKLMSTIVRHNADSLPNE